MHPSVGPVVVHPPPLYESDFHDDEESDAGYMRDDRVSTDVIDAEVVPDAGDEGTPPTSHAVAAPELINRKCPMVVTTVEVQNLKMPASERIALLNQQGPAYADDELLRGLENIASIATHEQNVTVLDPLVATSAIEHDRFDAVKACLQGLPYQSTVITAVAWNGHCCGDSKVPMFVVILLRLDVCQMRLLSGCIRWFRASRDGPSSQSTCFAHLM